MTSRHRDPAGDRPAAPSKRPAADPPQRRISLPFDIFLVSQRLGTYLDRALPAEVGWADHVARRDPVLDAAA